MKPSGAVFLTSQLQTFQDLETKLSVSLVKTRVLSVSGRTTMVLIRSCTCSNWWQGYPCLQCAREDKLYMASSPWPPRHRDVLMKFEISIPAIESALSKLDGRLMAASPSGIMHFWYRSTSGARTIGFRLSKVKKACGALIGLACQCGCLSNQHERGTSRNATILLCLSDSSCLR
jgi:hypothetical protein